MIASPGRKAGAALVCAIRRRIASHHMEHQRHLVAARSGNLFGQAEKSGTMVSSRDEAEVYINGVLAWMLVAL